MSGHAPTSGRTDDAAQVWGEPQDETPTNDDFAAWDQPADSDNQWDTPADSGDSWGEPAQDPRGWSPEPAQTDWDAQPQAAPAPRPWDSAEQMQHVPTADVPDTGGYELAQEPRQPVHHSASALIRDLPEAGEPKARRGWRALFGLPPSQDELSERADLAKVQRPLVGAKTVVVLNPKGGAGKTPTTLTLAGALGTSRGGSVVTLDNNELRGTMPLRTLPNGCRENVRTFVDNIESLRNSMSTAEIQRYMRHQGDGQYDALVCATDARHEVTAEEYDAVHQVLSRVYQLTVVDTGNNEGAANWQAALASADAIVVPVKRSSSSTCVAATQMLEELQKDYPNLVQNAVIVFTDGPGPISKAEYARHLEYFTQRARTVVELPTDPHIAAEVPIEHARLKSKTRRAALELAAAVSDVLTEPI